MDYQTLSGRARAAFTYRTRRPRDAALRKLLWLTFPPARGRRFRAHLDNVHSEWTIIHSGQHDVSTTSPELLSLLLRAAEAAQTVELSDISDRAGQTEEKFNVGRWPGEHYRLLRALAQVWNAKSIAEIGTSTGVSALTFARTGGVERVVTFDIHGWTYFPGTALRQEDFDGVVEQRLADLADPTKFLSNLDVLADADLIFIDGPKDGIFEPKFFDLLWRHPPSRRQLLVIDDIRVVSMVELWQRFPIAKLDASSLGHWSGTGLAIREPRS